MTKEYFKKSLKILTYIFAFIGFSLVVMYIAITSGLTKDKGLMDKQQESFTQNNFKNIDGTYWAESDEWQILEEAIKKDELEIKKASEVSGIKSRILVSLLIVEQLRLFYSDRDLFERAFAPLKVLGNQNVMSLGVMGIKPQTAIEIENNLKNLNSKFYLGKELENTLDFSTNQIVKERFERLTNEDTRFYSYLYASIFTKQILKQWADSGYNIEENIGVIATLYNLGFEKSEPKNDPKIGGSEIDLGIYSTTFGGLARDFYESEELVEEFPK